MSLSSFVSFYFCEAMVWRDLLHFSVSVSVSLLFGEFMLIFISFLFLIKCSIDCFTRDFCSMSRSFRF